MTPADVRSAKGIRRLAMLTAYDYPTALAIEQAGVDLILVGDSVAMVELGFPTTREATLAMMAHHVRAVRNGAVGTHVVGDMPAGSYDSPEGAVESARALVAAGADSVKLEGPCVAEVEAIVADGIAVMGHVGLQPQTATVYRKEGRTQSEADRIAAEARALEAAGCFAVVIEAVPAELATRITGELRVPTIGIAAGLETDGQVLVSTDLVGQLPFTPPFMSPKANVFGIVERVAREFAAEVRRGETVGVTADDWPTLS